MAPRQFPYSHTVPLVQEALQREQKPQLVVNTDNSPRSLCQNYRFIT